MKIQTQRICGLILFTSVALAELQGPVTPNTNDKISSDQTPSFQKEEENSSDEKGSKPENQRKISNILPDLGPELAIRTKLLQQHLVNRIWSEKLLKQNIEDQIAGIEKSRLNLELVDPTPEEIEGLIV